MRHGRPLNNKKIKLKNAQVSWKISHHLQWKTFILMMIFYRDITASIQIWNLQNFDDKTIKDSKGMSPNVFSNALISMCPGNHYVKNCVFSAFFLGRIQENTGQQKLLIWTLFTQWTSFYMSLFFNLVSAEQWASFCMCSFFSLVSAEPM